VSVQLGHRTASTSGSAIDWRSDLDLEVVLVRVAVADEDRVGLTAWLDGSGFEVVGVYCRRVGYVVISDRSSGDLMGQSESRKGGEAELEPSSC